MRHRRIILETRGDMLIRGLWKIQTDAIIDSRFRYSDVEIYVKEAIYTLLPRWEQTNKENNGQHKHEQRKNFSLFVSSVDGILGKEAQFVLATLSSIMAAKTEEPIFHVKGWVNFQIAITVTRLYSRMLHRAQFPILLRNREP